MRRWVTLSLFLAVATAQQCNTDVMFILDASGSVEDNYKNMIGFAKAISDLLVIKPNGHRVSFIAYSGRNTKILDVPFGVIQSNEGFDAAVENLPYFKGTTYTGRALKRAYELLQERRRDATTVVIVVTDGFSSDRVEAVSEQIRDLPRTTVYVAAIPDQISRRGMIAIAGSAERIFFQPGVAQKATAALEDILRCVPFRDPTTRRPTRRPTLPPTTTRRTTPRPTTTTPTTTTQRITGCEVDLLLIFDFSGSVSGIHNSYVDMGLKLVDTMRIDPFYTRVAMVKYSSKAWAHAVFEFKRYSTAAEVKEAISLSEYMGGTTDTNHALITAAEEFDEAKGSRPWAKKMAVVFTDGYSQHDPRPGADAMRALGVELYAVCTEKDDYPPNFEELAVIAGRESKVFEAKNVRQLLTQAASLNRNCRR